jgi:uncharacterized protein
LLVFFILAVGGGRPGLIFRTITHELHSGKRERKQARAVEHGVGLQNGAVTSSIAAPPSDQSINELLDVMNMPRMMDQILANMDQEIKAGMQRGLQQSLRGREPTAEQRAEVDKFQKKLMGIMRDELTFDKVKDIYVRVYRETFTQEEVNGLIAFYKSPAGKAYVEKVPSVMYGGIRFSG